MPSAADFVSQEPVDMQDAGALINDIIAPPKKVVPPKGPDGKFVKKEDVAAEVAAVDEEPEQKPETDAVEPAAEPEKADEPAEDEPEVVEPRLVRVKVDGQEIDVDEEELKKGYSRTADYTRKTQALATERAKFESEERAAVRAERQQYAERLAALAAVIPMPGEEPNWDDLRQRLTPEEFTEQFTQHRAATKRVEAVMAERQRVNDAMLRDTQDSLRAKVAEANERLGEMIPEWKDPVKGKALKDDLIAYAKSLDYTDDDLAQVYDPRLLVLLNKARLHDQDQKRKPTITAKIDRALDTIKPTSVPSQPKGKVLEAARTNLAKSGSVDDAATLLNAMKL